MCIKTKMQIYKRIALLGATANPNIGDEAILSANIQMIRKMYGSNCKIYVFTKDATYTGLYNSENSQIIAVDYLHKITVMNNYNVQNMQEHQKELLDYDAHSNLEVNFLYEALHNIFREIDILHIIGGGYLNSIWPDMLFETLTSAKLAQKYDKKYILTGISTYPMDNKYTPLLQELCEGAEHVDFRDGSFQDFQFMRGQKYNMTIDDAIFLEDYYPIANGEKYATILFHDWSGNTGNIIEKIDSEIIPFMQKCIENKCVDYFYVLGFAQGDLELWNKIEIPQSLIANIKFKNCINESSVMAKHIISNAIFSIGSRFHLAVFSLSATVPVLSVYYDNYYKNKIESIHETFSSESIISLDTLSFEVLSSFSENLTSLSKQLKDRLPQVYEKYLKKIKDISDAYGINNVDKVNLYSKIKGDFVPPKISVIIPIYNMDAYLRECLDSVISQSLKKIEIICINDGSTDYTQMILNEYAWKDKRIKVISQTNHGVAYARNAGIAAAKGEYLYFLDPDDWLPDDNVFLDVYSAAKKNNVLVCGGTFKEYATRGIIDQWDGNLCKYNFKEDGLINYSDYQFDYGWVRFIYNREFIVYNDLWIPSLKFFEDPVFFVQVMHKAKCFYGMKRCTYCYRTGHKSSELPYEKVLDLMKGLSVNLRFAKEHGYDELFALELARIENDYAELIVKHLLRRENTELRQLFSDLNQLIYDDNSRIEYRMFSKILGNKAARCDILEHEIEDARNIFYSSTTWKVGNLVLSIPKKLKNLLLRRK